MKTNVLLNKALNDIESVDIKIYDSVFSLIIILPNGVGLLPREWFQQFGAREWTQRLQEKIDLLDVKTRDSLVQNIIDKYDFELNNGVGLAIIWDISKYQSDEYQKVIELITNARATSILEHITALYS